MTGTTNREITVKECPWLDGDIPEGTNLYRWSSHTYGCITSAGVAVSHQDEQVPFFEIPEDSIDWSN